MKAAGPASLQRPKATCDTDGQMLEFYYDNIEAPAAKPAATTPASVPLTGRCRGAATNWASFVLVSASSSTIATRATAGGADILAIEAARISLASGAFCSQKSAPAAVFAVAALVEVALGQGCGGQRISVDVEG